MTEREIKSLLEYLPHAFGKLYWDLADTTYAEEVFLAIIKTQKIPKEKALKLQSKIFPKNKLIRQILKEEVTECMGCYGKGYIGTSFYGTNTKYYDKR